MFVNDTCETSPILGYRQFWQKLTILELFRRFNVLGSIDER